MRSAPLEVRDSASASHAHVLASRARTLLECLGSGAFALIQVHGRQESVSVWAEVY